MSHAAISRLPGSAQAPAGPGSAPGSASGSASSGRTPFRLADWTTLIGAALVGAAALGVVRFTLVDRIAALEAALAERPPLAVVDYGAIQQALAAGASPAELQPAFAQVKAEAAEKSRAGYLVINRAALEAAPERLVFSAPPIFMAQSRVGAPPMSAPTSLPSPATQMSDAEARAVLRALTAAGGAQAGGLPGARP
jgi:hypothetical protein